MVGFPENYRIVDRIAETTSGNIYAAVCTVDERPVWLYVRQPEANESFLLERKIQKEITVLESISHPQIPRLLEKQIKTNSENPFFFTFARETDSNWKTLREWVASGQELNTIQIYSICRKLVSALTAIHETGSIHGDLTPDLVLLCIISNTEIDLRILGMGTLPFLEQKQSYAGRGESRTTGESVFFRAPEAMGSSFFADPRMDVFSLGALIWYLLTRERPPEPNKLKIGDTPANDNPQIAGELASSLQKAMSPISMVRYANAKDFKDVLLPALAELLEESPEQKTDSDPLTPNSDTLPTSQAAQPPSQVTSSISQAASHVVRNVTPSEPFPALPPPPPPPPPPPATAPVAAAAPAPITPFNAHPVKTANESPWRSRGKEHLREEAKVLLGYNKTIGFIVAAIMIIFIGFLVVALDRDIKRRRGGLDLDMDANQNVVFILRDREKIRFEEKKITYMTYKDMRKDADRERLFSLGVYACKHDLSDELEWVMKEADEELNKKIRKKCEQLKK